MYFENKKFEIELKNQNPILEKLFWSKKIYSEKKIKRQNQENSEKIESNSCRKRNSEMCFRNSNLKIY